eukprot:NODE_112_length_18534_cov_1.163656.p20 type:complete len:121 gc:universal NODE_112_length_18534_cov_1.163656:6694-6332(-)
MSLYITSAIQYLHLNCYIHSNICSNSVMFDFNWNLKIVDMGHCIINQGIKESESSAYMAPECKSSNCSQIMDFEGKTAANIFRLGMLMGEIFSIEIPWHCRTEYILDDINWDQPCGRPFM